MENNLSGQLRLRSAIEDPYYFFGRADFLEDIQQKPLDVWILLGGRRIGKTSLLNAVEWSFLDPQPRDLNRVFPVLIDLNLVQPNNLDNLRYLLVAQLREAVERWRQISLAHLRAMYRAYIRQVVSGEVTISFLQQLNVKFKVSNPAYSRQLNDEDFRQALWKTIEELRKKDFHGICLILDGAEFIARQEWATDAWNYFRSLKDTKNILKPYLGLVLSGYRELKDYQQKVGSPLLGIAAGIKWLSPLTESESFQLIERWKDSEKIPLNDQWISSLIEWTGCHPYLIHLALEIVRDELFDGNPPSFKEVIINLMHHHTDVFAAWWNEDQEVGRLGEEERTIYHALVECRQGSPSSLARRTQLGSGKVKNMLDILSATGIVRKLSEQQYVIGTRLFEEWVKRL